MIYFPKIFGTCAGANKAIKLAFELKEKYKNKTIYIYKEILHNPYVIDLLNKSNIKCIDDLKTLNKDDILIIRAHGEAKCTYDYLNKKEVKYFDATCTNVTKIHDIIKENFKNKNIIIVGKKEHPEVIGTNGWCNNKAIIIENKDDYKNIDFNKEYFIVCQTTTNNNNLNDLLTYLDNNKVKYEYKNTICNASKLIQTSSLELAKNVDIMFIIGGKNSSNTKELFNQVSKITKSYYFSDIKDFFEFIKKEGFSNKTKIGFTGGASTLKSQIYEYSYLLEFIMYYKSKLKELTKEIKKYNNKLIKDENIIIKDAINKFINMNQDGKFIRGCLIDLGYKLHHNDNYSLPLSIAYETFETSILIHDDIIDNAYLRRGKDTIHELYKKEFYKYKNDDNTPTSLALCIGDLGMYYANKIISENYKNDKNLSKLLSYYNEVVMNTIKGEILDVYLPFIEKNDKNHKLNESDIMEIYKLKTSYYTIVGPFILGMILSSSSNKEINLFKDILIDLGMAFQIKDDILGIFGSDNTIGKSTSSDIEEFKQTILYSYIKINKQEYLNELLKYYGKKNKQKEIKNLFIKSGSLEYATNKMNELFYNVKSSVESLNIKENVKRILLGFIKYLELRDK